MMDLWIWPCGKRQPAGKGRSNKTTYPQLLIGLSRYAGLNQVLSVRAQPIQGDWGHYSSVGAQKRQTLEARLAPWPHTSPAR